MRNVRLYTVLVGGVLLAGSCSGGSGNAAPDYFTPRPACNADPTVPFTKGDQVLVIKDLAIAPPGVGFDFGAGMPQNSLFAIRALVKGAITKAFLSRSLLVPMEFYDDATGAKPASCLKFAFYYGIYKVDRDMDGAKVSDPVGSGDCNDHDKTIGPKQAEVAGDGIDNNCNGVADESVDASGNVTPGGLDSAAVANADADGDGVTIAMGDCNDHDPNVKPAKYGGKEICGNGIDDDCDGVADDAPCDPYDGTATAPIYVQATSFVKGSSPPQPAILFDSAAIQAVTGTSDAGASESLDVLTAGPNPFTLTLPGALAGTDLDLQLLGTRVRADVSTDSKGRVVLTNGVLGGVMTAQVLDAIKGINQPDVGIMPDDSLLDAVFAAGTLGRILALQQDANGHYLPDVNVDGGQFETFWGSTTDAGTPGTKIDTCQDNHGNVIMSTPTQRCVQVKGPDGKFLFNDGLSVALTFDAVPAEIQQMP